MDSFFSIVFYLCGYLSLFCFHISFFFVFLSFSSCICVCVCSRACVCVYSILLFYLYTAFALILVDLYDDSNASWCYSGNLCNIFPFDSLFENCVSFLLSFSFSLVLSFTPSAYRGCHFHYHSIKRPKKMHNCIVIIVFLNLLQEPWKMNGRRVFFPVNLFYFSLCKKHHVKWVKQ